jgi:hypothetical protein
MSSAAEDAVKAAALAKRCYPLFAGQGPDVQGAALAELVALHIACHVVQGDEVQTAQMREVMLELFVGTVKKLVPVLEALEVTPRLKERQP